MKRVFIVHGWDGYPEECWFPWLKQELEQRGFGVEVPQMPNPDAPTIQTWVPHLSKMIGTPDQETYLVGHSIGVQTILRYLQTVEALVGGVVAVAGFFTLIPGSIGTADDEAVAQPWLTTPMDVEKIKGNASKVVAIFSDNDRFVPLENVEMFQARLGAETIVLHNKGHIGGSDNAKDVPEILDTVLKIAGV
ncbi:hypothetical protein A3F28_04165 [Candidatus Uhrbacteria bacterium RIFCSPHIGHO2_12_FULL_57_11]|uniref:Alpha/beta hydrolase n=2 Tax=Candidatus Uhriibacteriota TaxID=1752732 RepID=A0A1F7ULD1_9BACT|nr:MAG: hypothetical protein A3D72_03580 [Candidatus Uhrbacteria bacterium RIFCSPHIGHO2_02_FULL_57_19]OGL78554.1 MAG: hypothetical protein A3F28_04165 [Candidatus Uhrbacteria bacterium RIFCSPHIGHO2_12_FULL_57_11]